MKTAPQYPNLKLRQRHPSRQKDAKREGFRVKSSSYRTRTRAADWR